MIIAFHAIPVKVVNFKSSIFLLCLGVNTAVAPVYLSEIAPIRLRGALGVLNQFGIVLGLLSGYILGLKQVCLLVKPFEGVFPDIIRIMECLSVCGGKQNQCTSMRCI